MPIQAVVDKLRRGVAWPLVFGRLATEAPQKVRITAVPDFILVEQNSAHMAQLD